MPYLIVSFSDRTAIASEFVIPVLSTTQQSRPPNTDGEEESPHHTPQGLPRRRELREDATFYQCEKEDFHE